MKSQVIGVYKLATRIFKSNGKIIGIGSVSAILFSSTVNNTAGIRVDLAPIVRRNLRNKLIFSVVEAT